MNLESNFAQNLGLFIFLYYLPTEKQHLKWKGNNLSTILCCFQFYLQSFVSWTNPLSLGWGVDEICNVDAKFNKKESLKGNRNWLQNGIWCFIRLFALTHHTNVFSLDFFISYCWITIEYFFIIRKNLFVKIRQILKEV